MVLHFNGSIVFLPTYRSTLLLRAMKLLLVLLFSWMGSMPVHGQASTQSVSWTQAGHFAGTSSSLV